MRNTTAFVLSFISFLVAACGVAPVDSETTALAEEQVSSGLLISIGPGNPIILLEGGMMYLEVSLADDGVSTDALSFYGDCQGLPCQWDPTVDDGRGFELYYDPNTGEPLAFYTKFSYPSSGRGNAAEPGSEGMAWDGDDTDAESEGVADGWYHLPADDTVPYITMVTDCGRTHPNIYFAFDADGKVATDEVESPAALGSDYCDSVSEEE
ncbi:MAG: hypothetical protein WCT28_03840 [Patescibacteria group bacterium]|jgi:hypothetical protein